MSDAREQPPTNMDIQMSSRLPRSNSDMGMEAFNKQVYLHEISYYPHIIYINLPE